LSRRVGGVYWALGLAGERRKVRSETGELGYAKTLYHNYKLQK